ncbi:hypothetical protein CLOSTMETH_03143 [[Clostridium] methylpentosum DSM 5476]|uniref:Uncharacterized protein n=1 Tax=[Clostridium] methylpentosum DSM 5476 TaxID=537013 RepID=C0EGZ8_9FIRM|nr:hypothetical protein CLOSTMETH_03143 [[Clostridium] methylpentosum DSM 5476]
MPEFASSLEKPSCLVSAAFSPPRASQQNSGFPPAVVNTKTVRAQRLSACCPALFDEPDCSIIGRCYFAGRLRTNNLTGPRGRSSQRWFRCEQILSS